MFLIDTDRTPAQAFRRGFLKGLASPVMLFGAEPAPVWLAIAQVPVPGQGDAAALAGDWQRIGGDLRAALNRYGQAA